MSIVPIEVLAYWQAGAGGFIVPLSAIFALKHSDAIPAILVLLPA